MGYCRLQRRKNGNKKAKKMERQRRNCVREKEEEAAPLK
jgi:hypothetical protein